MAISRSHCRCRSRHGAFPHFCVSARAGKEDSAIRSATSREDLVEQSKGATIRGFSQEKKNGQTYYEAELMVDGHAKDVLVDVNGSVVEVKEQVPTESLPAAVRQSLQDKAGKGKLVKVGTLTKKDKLVAYEARVLTNGKTSEVQVGTDGKPLDHEE